MPSHEYNAIFFNNENILIKYNNYAISRKDYVLVDFYTRLINYLLILYSIIKIS